MTRSTTRLRNSLLGAAALGLVLAACGSTNNAGNSSGTGSTGTGPNGTGTAGTVVTTADVGGTTVLVDSTGHTLYSADVEKGGMIRCLDGCTTFWVPLQATAQQASRASDALGDQFGVVRRPDGEQQLTYERMPLYTFAREGSDQLTGDGFTDSFQGMTFTWHAATTEQGAGTGPTQAPSTSSSGGGGYY